jgi:hypothetical protein
MFREPSRRGLLAVRVVKAAATAAVAGTAVVLTLSGAFASPVDETPGISAPAAELIGDTRCAGAAGKAIVRTEAGSTRAVPFEHGWRVYRGERPGTLVVVCPE